jgi:hypothetical protein
MIGVSAAVYSAASHASDERRSGVAFPNNDAYKNCVGKVLSALRTLNIEVFWVSENSVEVEHHWELWK